LTFCQEALLAFGNVIAATVATAIRSVKLEI